MTWVKLGCGLVCLGLAGAMAGAQERNAPAPASDAPSIVRAAQKELQPEKKAGQEKKDDKTAPPQVDLSVAPPTTAEATPAPSFNMIGDPPPLLYSLVLVPIPSLAKLIIPDGGQTIDIPFRGQRAVRVPVAGPMGFKIAENESPLPQDRVFFTYNYYNNVQWPDNGISQSIIVPQKVNFRGQEFDANIFIPGTTQPRFDVHRETLGFEKSFFDGNFSLGMRVPIFQQNGASEFSDADLGDLTFIVKYAPYIDRLSGSGLSTGLAVTVPTGPTVHTLHGDVRSTYLQPFIGYQLARERLLLYGFTSVAVPSDVEDVTLLFNDVGVAYRLFDGAGGLVSSIAPAVEAHVTTPLNHRAATDSIQGIDMVVLTGGVHIGLGRQSLLTLGVATPVSGPRTFDVEAIVQLNFRF